MAFLVGGSQAQQPTMRAPPPPRLDADSIVGVWKLNVDKSTNPSAASELITIVSQGGDFKLTFDIKQDNEYNPHYEVLTDMKGATVKPTYLDGKQTSDAWRVTRRGPKAFEMQLLGPFGGWKDRIRGKRRRQVIGTSPHSRQNRDCRWPNGSKRSLSTAFKSFRYLKRCNSLERQLIDRHRLLVRLRLRRGCSGFMILRQLRLFCLQHLHSLGKRSVGGHTPEVAEYLFRFD